MSNSILQCSEKDIFTADIIVFADPSTSRTDFVARHLGKLTKKCILFDFLTTSYGREKRLKEVLNDLEAPYIPWVEAFCTVSEDSTFPHWRRNVSVKLYAEDDSAALSAKRFINQILRLECYLIPFELKALPQCQLTVSAQASYILSTGVAFETTFTPADMLVAQCKMVRDNQDDKDVTNRVVHACRFNGHAVTLEEKNLFRTMTREEHLTLFRTNLLALAVKACEDALTTWGGDRNKITHLIWGTKAGALNSPSIDVLLVERLGLRIDVQRTSIESMGCLPSFQLLNLARSEVLANPKSRVLVVEGELRSALEKSTADKMSREGIVSVSSFRDEAGATVVGGGPRESEMSSYEIICGASRIIKDSHDHTDYFEANDGAIRLHLSNRLPEAIAKAERDFVHGLLADAAQCCAANSTNTPPALSDFDVVCNVGGSRVLKEVAKSIGLTDDHLESSSAVMHAMGDLCGVSTFAVLDHQNKRGGRAWVLCLSMGPGTRLEGLILRRAAGPHLGSCQKQLQVDLSVLEKVRLRTKPLGDPVVEEMVRLAIAKKLKQRHASVQYPKMWLLQGPRFVERFFAVSKWAIPLCLVAMLVVATYLLHPNEKRDSVICSLLTVTIIGFMVAVVSSFSLNSAMKLSFLGVWIMLLGALVNLIVSPTIWGSDNPPLIRLGSTVGFSLLALGVQIFAFTSFIFLG